MRQIHLFTFVNYKQHQKSKKSGISLGLCQSVSIRRFRVKKRLNINFSGAPVAVDKTVFNVSCFNREAQRSGGGVKADCLSPVGGLHIKQGADDCTWA